MRNDEFGERFFRLRVSVRNALLGAIQPQFCAFTDGILHGGPLGSSSGVASVDRQYRAGDETRRVGTKEHDDSSNVSRIPPSLLRGTLEDLGGARLVRDEVPRQLGHNPTGSNGVDPD